MVWSTLVDLAMTPEEQEDAGMVAAAPGDKGDGPRYPFGMSICFNKATLDKVGLTTNCSIGDLLDARIFGTITSISTNKRNDGTDDCSVSVQIEKMAVENEMKE
jgi:hypothetical protein